MVLKLDAISILFFECHCIGVWNLRKEFNSIFYLDVQKQNWYLFGFFHHGRRPLLRQPLAAVTAQRVVRPMKRRVAAPLLDPQHWRRPGEGDSLRLLPLRHVGSPPVEGGEVGTARQDGGTGLGGAARPSPPPAPVRRQRDRKSVV